MDFAKVGDYSYLTLKEELLASATHLKDALVMKAVEERYIDLADHPHGYHHGQAEPPPHRVVVVDLGRVAQ